MERTTAIVGPRLLGAIAAGHDGKLGISRPVSEEGTRVPGVEQEDAQI